MAATLFHLGKPVVFSAGTLLPGAKLFFYATGTSTKVPIYTTWALNQPHSNPVVADSFGKLPAIYLDQDEGNVKYVIAPQTDSDPPSSAIETVDPFIVSEPVQASTYDPNKTTAEIAAGISSVNSAYPPGDIRRYGAISDGATDCASAWQAALAQASITSSPKGSPVYIPGSQQGWKISAGATVIGGPVSVYGDNSYFSYLFSTSDITFLTLKNIHQNAGPVLRDFCFTKSGASTKPCLLVENCSHGQIKGALIRGGAKGLRFDPTAEAPSSCYLWSIEDSVIIENTEMGIDAGTATNYLTLRNVTLASQPIGIRVFESAGFSWYGGDAESISNIAIDLDASVEVRMGALITGVDFENCAGDSLIRIGNTALIRCVTTISNGMFNTSAVNYVINAQRVDRLTMIGDSANTATLSGDWINTSGAQLPTHVVMMNNPYSAHTIEILNGTLGYADATLGVGFSGRHADALHALTYGTTVVPDAALGNLQSLTIQDAVAFTINNPDNPVTGQELTFWIVNASGGAHGAITWAGGYKLGGAFPAIANGFNRFVTFVYTGALWYESDRSPADVPN